MKFSIAYQVITCPGCRAQRIRGLTCPDCGQQPDPREVDNHWLRRRKTVPDLELLLDKRPAVAPWRSQEQFRKEVFEELTPILPTTFAAMQTFVTGKDDGDELKTAINQFVHLRERIRRVDQRRPYLLLACTAGGVADEIEEMLRCYLHAFAANIPLRAQRFADQAQAHIDRAAEHAEAFNRLVEAADEPLDTTSSAALTQSMFANYMTRTGATLEQTLREGEERIGDLLGVSGDTNAGMQLLVFEDYAAAHLDRDRFLATVTAAYRIFTDNGSELTRQVTEAPELLHDYVDVQVGVFNSGWQVLQTIGHAQTDRQVLEAALDVEAELVEGAGALIARLLMLVIGHKKAPYAKLKQGHATEDLRTARALPNLQPLLAGLDGDLRTAKAHRQVRYDTTSITITPRSGARTIEVDELVDTLLEGIESTLACLVALTQAFADLGIDGGGQTFHEQIGVSTVDLAETALRLMTGADANIYVTGEHLMVDIDGPVGTWSLFSLVGSLGPLLDDVDTYRLTHISSITRTISGPTAPYRNGLPSDEFEKQLRCIRVALTSQLDGMPWIGSDQLRKWASHKATDALRSPDHRTGARQLRQLIGLAIDAPDPGLEQTLRECMRWRRLDQPNPNTLDQLEKWGLADVDWELP